MSTVSLSTLGSELLADAHAHKSGRAARTVRGHGDHRLRHTVIAMTGGSRLSDHESPDEATLLVLRGKVHITSAEQTWPAAQGDLLDIPPVRHGLAADEDSVVLLTVRL
ncbi:hypothetical protein GOARA_015_00320 [Gordonia araii NBRC 100433]|uniref:Cupin 2 conserved barrel domain-containing protein n=1 Tax=Gordonia araii NBRC 100433 TaxID=1073574 RepID=G7GYL9_9ACTN|nr:hypothetical protein [Gordonia araii]NNG97446.1 cupin [Gordonia araii NBRC 100433]GAB08694.1 hypothetical protein GOARA_015_00320 [Gordonia araii NBRC 100433]